MKRQNVTLQQTIKFLISVLSFPSPVSLILSSSSAFCTQFFQPKHIGIWEMREYSQTRDFDTTSSLGPWDEWRVRHATRDSRLNYVCHTPVLLSLRLCLWLSVPTGLTVSRTDSSCGRQSVFLSLSPSFLSSGTILLSPLSCFSGETARNREKEKVLHVYFDFHGEEFVRSAPPTESLAVEERKGKFPVMNAGNEYGYSILWEMKFWGKKR